MQSENVYIDCKQRSINEIVEEKNDQNGIPKSGYTSGKEPDNLIVKNVMNISYSMNEYNQQPIMCDKYQQSQEQLSNLQHHIYRINTSDHMKSSWGLPVSREGSPETSLELPDDCAHSKGIKVRIRQQPVHARMIGFAEKDRRPIDPPPILELISDNMNSDFYE